MPKLSEIRDSSFLTKEDVGKGMLLTITGCHQREVGREKEKLWCLTFAETEKEMVLKTTNAALIQSFLGGDDTDQWIGKKIVAFNDMSVMMGSKPVGGIRVRAPKPQVMAQPQAPAAQPQAPMPPPVSNQPPEDDVPF
jgi:hypothetical protein